MRFVNGAFYRLPSGQHVKAVEKLDEKKIVLLGLKDNQVESIGADYIDYPGVTEISVATWEALKSEANPISPLQIAVYPSTASVPVTAQKTVVEKKSQPKE